MNTNLEHVFTQHLAEALARKTDALIREAATRFLGRDDWLLDDLMGRAVMTILPNRNEVFSIDGVPILEVQPVDLNLNSTTIAANRKYRFLVGNVEIDAALGGLSDVIGQMLQERGREDASGARRAILQRMADGDFSTAARLIGCDEQTARELVAARTQRARGEDE